MASTTIPGRISATLAGCASHQPGVRWLHPATRTVYTNCHCVLPGFEPVIQGREPQHLPPRLFRLSACHEHGAWLTRNNRCAGSRGIEPLPWSLWTMCLASTGTLPPRTGYPPDDTICRQPPDPIGNLRSSQAITLTPEGSTWPLSAASVDPVPTPGLEPGHLAVLHFECSASADSARWACGSLTSLPRTCC